MRIWGSLCLLVCFLLCATALADLWPSRGQGIGYCAFCREDQPDSHDTTHGLTRPAPPQLNHTFTPLPPPSSLPPPRPAAREVRAVPPPPRRVVVQGPDPLQLRVERMQQREKARRLAEELERLWEERTELENSLAKERGLIRAFESAGRAQREQQRSLEANIEKSRQDRKQAATLEAATATKLERAQKRTRKKVDELFRRLERLRREGQLPGPAEGLELPPLTPPVVLVPVTSEKTKRAQVAAVIEVQPEPGSVPEPGNPGIAGDRELLIRANSNLRSKLSELREQKRTLGERFERDTAISGGRARFVEENWKAIELLKSRTRATVKELAIEAAREEVALLGQEALKRHLGSNWNPFADLSQTAHQELARFAPTLLQLKTLKDFGQIMHHQADELPDFFADLRAVIESGFEPQLVDRVAARLSVDYDEFGEELMELGLPSQATMLFKDLRELTK